MSTSATAIDYRKYLLSTLRSDIAMLKRLDGEGQSPGTSNVSRLLRREEDILLYARIKHTFGVAEKGDLPNCMQGNKVGILEIVDSNWVLATHEKDIQEGSEGLVPRNYIQELSFDL